MKRFFYILFCLIFLLGVLWSGTKLYSTFRSYEEADDSYEELQQFVSTPAPTAEPVAVTPSAEPVSGSEEPLPEETPEPQSSVDFASLQELNDDVVGWIRIDGMRIDYPIAQAEDNEYYLNHLLDGSWNGTGTIFLDYRCPADFTAAHSIIYGHHMQSGSMFAGLMSYKQQAFFDGHPTAFLATPLGDKTVYFFSGYVADTYNGAPAWELDLDDAETYEEWVEGAISRSYFSSSVRPAPGEPILTLATCSYEFEDARFVLHGVIR